jgi:hypothetical protein
MARGLGDAIGAGAVSGLRQTDDAAERLDRARNTLIVSGHDDGVDAASVGGTAIDVLDHRTSDDISENLSGETRRIVAGGDDGDDVLL